MTDQNFTAEENLAYIRSVMETTRKRTTQSGSFLAVWGTLSSLVTFFQYLAIAGSFPLAYMPYLWGSFVIAGTGYSILKGRSMASKNGDLSGNELITANLFTAIGISIFIFFVANIAAVIMGTIDHMGVEVCYVISLVMAIAFYGASYSTGIKWLRLVAYGWWAAVILFITRPFADEYLLLVIAALDFLLLAVPGFRLMALAKNDPA